MKKFNFEKFGFYRNIIFIGFFALFLCFLLFATTFDVHAANLGGLPYLVDDEVPFEFSTVVNQAFSQYGNIGNTGLTKDDVLNCDNYLLFIGSDTNDYTVYRYYIVLDDSAYSCSLGNESYENFEVGTGDTLTIYFNGYGSNNGKFIVLSYEHNKNTNNYYPAGYSYNTNATLQLFNAFPEQYPLSYPLQIKSNFYFGDYIVLTNETSPFISVGHASEPNYDPDSIISDSNGDPITHPNPFHPTPYSPTPFNPPSIVLSSVESLLESIFDLVSYGFNSFTSNFSGWFNNLLSNLDSWFRYVGNAIFYGVNKIISSLQDLGDFLYNNFVSLFEPLYDFLGSVQTFFSNLVGLGTDVNGNFSLTIFVGKLLVPDPDDLASILLESDMFGIVDLFLAVKSFISDFFSTIFNLQASKVFTIPGFTAFGTSFPSYQVDFSWFDDYKNYSDAIITAFLVIGYAHWFFIQLAPMLRGGGVVGHEQSTDASKKVGG